MLYTQFLNTHSGSTYTWLVWIFISSRFPVWKIKLCNSFLNFVMHIYIDSDSLINPIIWICLKKLFYCKNFLISIYSRHWVDELQKHEHGEEPSLLMSLFKMVAYKLFICGILCLIMVCISFLRIFGHYLAYQEN